MLASLAQFIPSALHIGPNDDQLPNEASKEALRYDTDDDEGTAARALDQSLPTDEMGVRKKEKELKRNPVENFIIVRPPPSMSNHPLNLQVQLLPPHSRGPAGLVSSISTGRRSTDSTNVVVSQPTPTQGQPFPDTQGAALERTSSNHSTASTTSTSGYGSTSSFSSVASTSSSASSARRAIVPLYNLQAHNVMTNTIVDAGTDAKVAKCRSKGLELIDLAFLEPVEVWGDPLTGLPLTTPNAKGASDENPPARSSAISQRLFSGGNNSRPVTPDVHSQSPATSSAISLNSTTPGTVHAPPIIAVPSQSAVPSASQAAPPKRNIFNKLFKKTPKEATQSSPSIAPTSLFGGHKRMPSVPTVSIPGGHTSQPISGLPTSSPTHTRNLSAQLHGLAPAPELGRRRSFSPMPNSRDGGAGYANGNGHAHHENGGNDASGLLHPNSNPANWSSPSAHGQSNSSSSGFAGNPPSLNPTPTNSGILQEKPSQRDLAAMMRPPVLGIQATLSAPLPNPMPKYARALMYVWFLRKWVKKTAGDGPASNFTFSLSGDKEGGGGSGIFGGVLRVGGGDKGGSHLTTTQQVEVRFEWRRSGAGKKKVAAAIAAAVAAEERGEGSTSSRGRGGKKKKDKDGQEQGRRVSESGVSMKTSSTGSDEQQQGREKSQSPGPRSREKKKKRRSWAAKDGADVADEDAPNGDATGEADRERDDGYESDPEDSETPWVCTLKLRKIGNWNYPAPTAGGPDKHHDTSASTSTSTLEHHQHHLQPQPPNLPPRPPPPPNVVKLKVATLSPTPHHPKVIAMLKVPFPLPDIEVETLTVVRKRKKGPNGEEKPPYVFTGTKLSAEEIKDIVSSTALWLVVRESFAGIGKVPRKGDGWRIRP